jgi:uncharacterized protein YndB with AHSA1/START domain
METRTNVKTSSARSVADLDTGQIIASVEVAASPERVFQALASDDVVDWWVRPGVFDTRAWTGDVRVGGGWRTSGVGNGHPYVLEGEFVELDPPRKLVHTWRAAQESAVTTVTYRLDPVHAGTRVTLHHSGFTSSQTCRNTCLGWETSFERLEEMLASEHSSSRG